MLIKHGNKSSEMFPLPKNKNIEFLRKKPKTLTSKPNTNKKKKKMKTNKL